MNEHETRKFTTSKDYDRFSRERVVLGGLSEKQADALDKAVALSPGYFFRLVKYQLVNGERWPSHGTHVRIFSDEVEENEVALVRHDGAQFYDNRRATWDACKRVLHRVYRRSGLSLENESNLIEN